jgi:hypothetical protein
MVHSFGGGQDGTSSRSLPSLSQAHTYTHTRTPARTHTLTHSLTHSLITRARCTLCCSLALLRMLTSASPPCFGGTCELRDASCCWRIVACVSKPTPRLSQCAIALGYLTSRLSVPTHSLIQLTHSPTHALAHSLTYPQAHLRIS